MQLALNRTARDSYTHAPEPECCSVRYAHENSGVQGKRAYSARYTECANLMHLGLVLMTKIVTVCSNQ